MFLTHDHYYVFLSSCAEIFGTLVGLISLVYVYKTESCRSNVERLVGNIERALKKGKFPEDQLNHYKDLGLDGLSKMVDELKEYFSSSDWEMLKGSAEGLKQFQSEMSSLKQAFKRAAISAFVVLGSTLIGLALPLSVLPGLGHFVFYLNLFLVLGSGYLSVNFVRELMTEKHLFMVASD